MLKSPMFVKSLALVMILGLGLVATAQTGAQTNVTQTNPTQTAQSDSDVTLAQARALAEDARRTYGDGPQNVDSPLWQKALRAAESLKGSESEPELFSLLATSYGYVKWYSRAYENWLEYFEAGGTLAEATATNPNSEGLFGEAGTELGFARYEADDLRGALPFYENVLDYLPEDQESTRWLGRIHLELGEPQRALAYWQALQALSPDDETIDYYIGLAEEQIEVGPAASTAFQEGIGAYEAGDIEEALGAFQTALEENRSFKNAYVWAGRSALELGESIQAQNYWERVLELDPEDERAEYFLSLAGEQERWGQAAADAFFEGQTLYLQGDLEDAASVFERAFDLNPEYKDAAVWAARSYQEAGNLESAGRYWQEVLELEPDNTQAKRFLQLTQTQTEGAEAGQALVQGVSAFESADLDAAAVHFETAVAQDENSADAWGWLARVYFTQENYPEAADAYARAAELEPSNDGYSFFQREAERLAGE